MKRSFLVVVLMLWAAVSIAALVLLVGISRPKRIIIVIRPSPQLPQEVEGDLTTVSALTGYDIDLWVRMLENPKMRAECEDLLRREFALLGLKLDPDPAMVRTREEAIEAANGYSDLCFERCNRISGRCLDAFCLGYFCGTVPLLAETVSDGQEAKAKKTMGNCINEAEEAMKRLGLPDEVSGGAEELRRKLINLKNHDDYPQFGQDTWLWFQRAYESLDDFKTQPPEPSLPEPESGTIETLSPQAPFPACGFL